MMKYVLNYYDYERKWSVYRDFVRIYNDWVLILFGGSIKMVNSK